MKVYTTFFRVQNNQNNSKWFEYTLSRHIISVIKVPHQPIKKVNRKLSVRLFVRFFFSFFCVVQCIYISRISRIIIFFMALRFVFCTCIFRAMRMHSFYSINSIHIGQFWMQFGSLIEIKSKLVYHG